MATPPPPLYSTLTREALAVLAVDDPVGGLADAGSDDSNSEIDIVIGASPISTTHRYRSSTTTTSSSSSSRGSSSSNRSSVHRKPIAIASLDLTVDTAWILGALRQAFDKPELAAWSLRAREDHPKNPAKAKQLPGEKKVKRANAFLFTIKTGLNFYITGRGVPETIVFEAWSTLDRSLIEWDRLSPTLPGAKGYEFGCEDDFNLHISLSEFFLEINHNLDDSREKYDRTFARMAATTDVGFCSPPARRLKKPVMQTLVRASRRQPPPTTTRRTTLSRSTSTMTVSSKTDSIRKEGCAIS